MSDLIKRLRNYRIGDYQVAEPLDECIEAAAEVERLRTENELISSRMNELEHALVVLQAATAGTAYQKEHPYHEASLIALRALKKEGWGND